MFSLSEVVKSNYILYTEGRVYPSRFKNLVQLPFAEAFACTHHTGAALLKIVPSLLKLPFSLSYLLLDGGKQDEKLGYFHKTIPGITDVMKSALKAAVCFANIFIAPFVGALSPKEIYEYHLMMGLISEIPPRIKKKEEKLSFNDLKGMDELIKKLQNEVIKPIKNPELFKELGLSAPNGILFYGPPGNGKTFLAKILADELGRELIKPSQDEKSSTYHHGTALKIESIFKSAFQKKNCVILLDEFDGMAGSRENLSGNAQEYHASEMSVILDRLTECAEHNVLVVATTNLKQNIDDAAIRAGRMVQYEISLPSEGGRKALLQSLVEKYPVCFENIQDQEFTKLAQATEGCSSSDIEQIVNTAKFKYVETEKKVVFEGLRNIIDEYMKQKKPAAPSEQKGNNTPLMTETKVKSIVADQLLVFLEALKK